MHSRLSWASLLLSFGLVACSGKMEKLRDGLAGGTLQSDAPRCADREALPACLDSGAAHFAKGAKFDASNPDQASAAALAIMVAEGHADWVHNTDEWLAVVRSAEGPGADALRLAIANTLAAHVAGLDGALEDEMAVRKLFLAVAAAVPGACETYERLGAGAADESLALTLSADHSPCVQRDLKRQSGPGGAYGYGLWRAAAGALASWNTTVDALENGLPKASPKVRGAIKARIDALGPARRSIRVKKVDRPVGNQWNEGTHRERAMP